MRRRADTSPISAAPPLTQRPAPAFAYSHVSTYRSTQLELQLYSPSLRASDRRGGPVAVFGEHDQLGGKVTLDASCYRTGRLTISVEGAFICSPPKGSGQRSIPLQPQRHLFLSLTTAISLSTANTEGGPPRSAFRGALTRRRTLSNASIIVPSSERSHPFTFHLPQGVRPGEEIPASFSSSQIPLSPDYFEVSYKICADWEPSDDFGTSHLEVPFIIQPDIGFQCIDASKQPDSWLEMPLKSERPILVRSAITMPTSVTFSRGSSIPFFVVFTTTPRSPELAKEIAADATISVSLIRQVVVSEHTSLPPTPSLTPIGGDEPDGNPRQRLLRRVGRSQPMLMRQRGTSDGAINLRRNKPLPQPPHLKSFTDSRTLYHDMSIGFPKRPRQQCDSQKHPSLEAIAALPDGLYKAKLPLSKNMLPCIDWAGVHVKYYLEVSVLLGPDDFRARIPIRIL